MGNELQRADKGFVGFLKGLTMTNTDRANSINRSVVEYKPCPIEAFFSPDNGVYNSLISGGDYRLRNSAMVAQAICAFQNGFPVVIIHEGNFQLEQELRNNFSGMCTYVEIGRNIPCFEPFYGLSEIEISSQIIEIAPKEYDIKYNARYYIDGISAFINASRKKRSFKMFSTCPHSTIFDKIDDMETQGKIKPNQAQEIKSKLMMGQSEVYKIDSLLASLKMEIDSMMFTANRGYKPVNIISSLQTNSMLTIDISSVTNKLFINTIIFQLKLALTKGISYQLIIDNIPLASNEAFSSFIKTPSDKVCLTVASEDFYSMVGSDEKIFSMIVGNCPNLIVMNHTAGHSATKWAEVFGQYDKYEESYQSSRGASRQTPFSIFASPNYSNTVSIGKNREYIVKPETIARLGNGEAYVFSGALGSLCHLYFTG